MKAVSGYDKNAISRIANNCGSKSLKSEISYLGVQVYRSKEKIIIETIDETAFFAIYLGKKHIRLIFIAVEEENQGKGYGKIMFRRIVSIAKEKGIQKITFRTSMSENAIDFYEHIGAKVIGISGNDYEMEYSVD